MAHSANSDTIFNIRHAIRRPSKPSFCDSLPLAVAYVGYAGADHDDGLGGNGQAISV
jgi:hypothetical protein